MLATITRPHDRQRGLRGGALLLLLLALAPAVSAQSGDRELARAIWCRGELSAVIHITVRREDASEAVGTAFRVSPRYALTARHLVGRINVHGVRLASISGITMRFAGPDGPSQPLDPRRVLDAQSGDLAILDLGFVEPPPPHLQVGNSYTVQRDDFVTFYGYGLSEPGAVRFGRVDLPDSENGQIRAEVNSQRGFSGAPVLNRRGNVIGVLSGGTPGVAYIAPIHHAEAELRLRGVLIPDPQRESDRVAGRTACPETRSDTTPPSPTPQQSVGGPQVTTHGPNAPGIIANGDVQVQIEGTSSPRQPRQ